MGKRRSKISLMLKYYGVRFLKNCQAQLLSKSDIKIPIRIFFLLIEKKSSKADLIRNFAKIRNCFMFENILRVLVPANSYFLLANQVRT